MIYPCFQCESREIGCHASCPKYREASMENDKRKEAHKAEHSILRFAKEVHANGVKYDHWVRYNRG